MARTDILHSDLFISWTGADRDMKNQIVAYLRKHNINCTESDHDCTGDFQQWSREAVAQSTVFLLLYTEHTPHSKFVPVEIAAFKELDDHYNRCVPVVTNFQLYAQNLPELADHESAVILDSNGLTEEKLEKILFNVRSLICNRLFSIYRNATAPAYLRFVSLMREMRITAEFEHERLYINRSVTDEEGQSLANAAVFCKSQDILYLYGPAGSGKTCYIDQLRNAADEDTLVLTLSCRTLVHTHSLFKQMYDEFYRYCGNRDYFSEENFQSLLSVKHLLLVLDGLDEIATQEGKDTLFRAVQDYYLANADSTTLFITCRNREDADMWKMNGQTPKVLQLHALEEDQIHAFGDNLFLLFGVPERSDEFYVDVRDLADEIRTNPLLLSQLAIVYKEKSQIPQTTVGIYDAVYEIIVDKVKPGASMPIDFDKAIFSKLSAILKCFSAERYRLLTQGAEKTIEQIFRKVLRDHGYNPEDALPLIQYLQDRAIMVDNEFYHKTLLEYFTAVYYYEQCFDDYDELENRDMLNSLFSHYTERYWSGVLQMFLTKADSRVDTDTTAALYHALLELDITDFTLLFDACQKLIRQKEVAQEVLLTDILTRSAGGDYPPYGPLFWYVPEYKLYGVLLSALASLQDDPCFTKALALTRDVCWIFGKIHTAETANSRINGRALLEKAQLSGVRQGLCELFYLGSTDCDIAGDIYPRCFNVAEATCWKETGQGIYGRMNTPFEDELGLYAHEMLRPFGGEWVGIVSMEYDIPRIEETLSSLSCSKLRGLFLSPSWYLKMLKLAINDKHLSVIYVPENVRFQAEARAIRPFAYPGIFVHDDGLKYFYDKVILPDGIAEIGAHAFAGCSSLTSITIPEGVTEIGSHAFDGCSSLTAVTLPESVTEIDIYAFCGCHALTSIIIPDGVTKVGWSVFEDCRSLTSITLPDRITEVGRSAFEGCSSLAAVTIPENVTEIEESVFRGCRSLHSITIPEGITTIASHAFAGCSSLTSITIPESVTWIEDAVFEGCRSLTSITLPENLPGIGQATFRNCSALASLNIPCSVTGIEEKAFEGCSSLTSIMIPDGVEGIERETFRNCSSLSSIILPDGVCYIGEASFAGCNSLASIRIPEQLRCLEHGAFAACTALTHITNCPTFLDRAKLGVSDDCVIDYREIKQMNVVFHSETEILPEEFYGREDITSIVLPERVTKIGVCAFRDCRSLSSITIPEGVTEIGGEAFSGCSSLTSVVLPAGMAKIEFGTFSGCSSLTSIVIPQGVVEIESGAFGGCNSLTSIIIPDKVTAIGASAFFGCNSLTSIIIPDKVTAIGAYAFSGCSSLTSVILPDHATKIEGYAFEGCSSLVSLVIPKGVTEIGWCTFEGCRSLTSVTIPEGVAEIGLSAFEGCGSLTSVTIPAGVTKLEACVFRGCSSLTSITIPEGATEIGSHAFEGCVSLTSVTLPKSVAEIGIFAFEGCRSLTSINIPDGVTKVGWSAFAGCSALTSITLPDRVTEVGISAFAGCSSLAAVTIPESVTTIDAHTFSGCNSLVSISIPKTVRTIGNNAFAGCTGLQEIELSRRFEDDLSRIFPGVDLSEEKIKWL